MTDPIIEVLKEHLGIDDERAKLFKTMIDGNQKDSRHLGLFDLKRDVEALEHMERALKELTRVLDTDTLTPSARELLLLELNHRLNPEAQKFNSKDPLVSLFTQHFDVERGLLELSDLKQKIEIIHGTIGSIKSVVFLSSKSRKGISRMNTRAINLVGMSKIIWLLSQKKQPPAKELNPATPLGEFLYDLFEACGVKGDPKASYRAWSKLE